MRDSPNITDSKHRYSVRGNQIYDYATKTGRIVHNLPSDYALAMMSEAKFKRCCKVAIETGSWPH